MSTPCPSLPPHAPEAATPSPHDSGYLPAVLFPTRAVALAALKTLPPTAQEQMALDAFEAAVLRDGEAQARLQNLLETVISNRKAPK